MTVSSPSGGTGGRWSPSFSAFKISRASAQPLASPRRSGWPSRRNATSLTVANACMARAGDRSTPASLSRRPQALNQQRQRRHKNMCLDSYLDMVIDRSQRHHVLELAEPTLDLGQFLVHRHRVQDAQSLLAGHDHIFTFDLL